MPKKIYPREYQIGTCFLCQKCLNCDELLSFKSCQCDLSKKVKNKKKRKSYSRVYDANTKHKIYSDLQLSKLDKANKTYSYKIDFSQKFNYCLCSVCHNLMTKSKKSQIKKTRSTDSQETKSNQRLTRLTRSISSKLQRQQKIINLSDDGNGSGDNDDGNGDDGNGDDGNGDDGNGDDGNDNDGNNDDDGNNGDYDDDDGNNGGGNNDNEEDKVEDDDELDLDYIEQDNDFNIETEQNEELDETNNSESESDDDISEITFKLVIKKMVKIVQLNGKLFTKQNIKISLEICIF
jgi:hypothetical protein